MSTTYINGLVTKTIMLGSASYPGPLTIGPEGTVAPYGGTGMLGSRGLAGIDCTPSTSDFMLTNNGYINAGGGADTTTGGIGVDLTATGSTLVNTHGHIFGGPGYKGAGGGAGVYALNGTLTNDNEISGGKVDGTVNDIKYADSATAGVGVILVGGSLTNSESGVIRGGDGNILGATGNGGNGVKLSSAATFTNSVDVFGGQGAAVGGIGVYLTSGSQLTNSADGRINGGGGVLNGAAVVASGTHTLVTNAGTLYGGGTGGAGNPGAAVDLSSTASMTNTSTGLIKGLAGAAGVDVASGASLTNAGFVEAYGSGNLAGVYLDGGTLTDSGFISGAGFGTNSAAVQFALGSDNTVSLSGSWNLMGGIGGLAKDDTIDIAGVYYKTARSDFSFTNAGDTTATLNLSQYGGQDLTFSGLYGGEPISIVSDGHGGTLIEVAACFAVGTRIRTAHGETPIETLKIGDEVMTTSGVTRPIRWIGRRRYSTAVVAGNRHVLPILIRAGALGDGVPLRNLKVSPDHAMWIEGLLIPARELVNGLSIVQEETGTAVAYVHLEFDTHDVIWAEGAPAESFADDESRCRFDNAEEYRTLYPESKRQTSSRFCAPRVEEGEELETVRRRIVQRSKGILRQAA